MGTARDRADRGPIRRECRGSQSAVRATAHGARRATSRPRSGASERAPCARASMAANCDIKDCRAGSRSTSRSMCPGPGSRWAICIQPGRRRITFCGGDRNGRLAASQGRHHQGRVQSTASEPRVQAVAHHAELQGLSDLRRHLGRRRGKQHYSTCISPTAGLPERDSSTQKIRLFRRQAYSILGTTPCQGHISGVV